jgi:hypothetical protein
MSMNWQQATRRIANTQATSQGEAIVILRQLLANAAERDANAVLFETGVLVLSLVDCWDHREAAAGAWTSDEDALLNDLADLIAYDNRAASFNDYLRRLIDRHDAWRKRREADGSIATSRFSSIAEALDALPAIEQEVLAWETAQEQQAALANDQADTPPPQRWRKEIPRHHKRRLWQAAGLALTALAIYAAFQEDGYFFLLLFGLAFETALIYAARHKGDGRQSKMLPALVGGFAVACLIVGIVALLYLNSSQEYRRLGDPRPILSKRAFIDSYPERHGSVFLSGTVSEENADYAGGEGCAIVVREHAQGPSELLIELDGGSVAITGHLLDRNSQNRKIRLGWTWQGMKNRRIWQCLRIGKPVSIRGVLQGSRSLDGSRTRVALLAEEIFPGSTSAHAEYLREHMPRASWAILMAKISSILFIIFILVFGYYAFHLIRSKIQKTKHLI